MIDSPSPKALHALRRLRKNARRSLKERLRIPARERIP